MQFAVGKEQGYTLIELLVTMSVVAILATVAVPNFVSFIDNSRERADVQQLLKNLVAARSEAVVRARSVHLTAVDGDWAKGWRVWADTNTNGSYDSGEEFKVATAIKTSALITAQIDGSAVTEVSFDSQGFAASGQSVTFSYRSQPEKCGHDRDLTITPSGQTSIADRVCP
ncbi:GspH/FimT family pseudopilin [Zhongshania borealis]|uniref:Type II secretion system protein H n=1 Tax=Zhongshania borealis TaxID=889488 RepID=A0ABP7X3U9_9GAMM